MDSERVSGGEELDRLGGRHRGHVPVVEPEHLHAVSYTHLTLPTSDLV